MIQVTQSVIILWSYISSYIIINLQVLTNKEKCESNLQFLFSRVTLEDTIKKLYMSKPSQDNDIATKKIPNIFSPFKFQRFYHMKHVSILTTTLESANIASTFKKKIKKWKGILYADVSKIYERYLFQLLYISVDLDKVWMHDTVLYIRDWEIKKVYRQQQKYLQHF